MTSITARQSAASRGARMHEAELRAWLQLMMPRVIPYEHCGCEYRDERDGVVPFRSPPFRGGGSEAVPS